MAKNQFSFSGSVGQVSDDLNIIENCDTEQWIDNEASLDNPELTIKADDDFYRDEEETEVELGYEDICNLVCDVLEKQPKLIYDLSRAGKLNYTLAEISKCVAERSGYTIDLIEAFKTIPEVEAFIKLVAKGFLARPKFQYAVKNPVKIILLPDCNNIHLQENAIAPGVHRYKNGVAITRVSANLINKAKAYLGSYRDFNDLINACSDIVLVEKVKPNRPSVEYIKKLSKKELAELTLSGDLRFSDLYRAKINPQVIANIKSLIR